MGSYSPTEVIWLLSLTRSDAITIDEGFRDSCLGLVAALQGAALSAEGPPVPTIARWNDVHRARTAIIDAKQAVAILQLRASGFSERELARLSDNSRLAVRRRWRTPVDEIIARLGGGDDSTPMLSHVDLCLACGEQPRIRLQPVRRRVKGGWETTQEGRMASVCLECLRPELLPRIAGWQEAVFILSLILPLPASKPRRIRRGHAPAATPEIIAA